MTGWRRSSCDCCDSGGCAINSTMGAGVGASFCCAAACGGWYPDATTQQCIDVNFYLPAMTWYRICEGEPVVYLQREAWDTTVRLLSQNLHATDAYRCAFWCDSFGDTDPTYPYVYQYDCDGVCETRYQPTNMTMELQASGGLRSNSATLLGYPWEIATPCDAADDYCSGIVLKWRLQSGCHDCSHPFNDCVTPTGNHIQTEYGQIAYYNNAVDNCDSSVGWLAKYATGTPDQYGSRLKSCTLGVDEYCGGSAEYAKDWDDGGDSTNEFPLLDCADDYRTCSDPVPFIASIEQGTGC